VKLVPGKAVARALANRHQPISAIVTVASSSAHDEAVVTLRST